ncbi:hypothetical protein Ahy_A03g014322 isoform F [Arachis hypogaea]|uniref:Uncharacterized protein n=1 Tax=Arachis hypogaea TaxID=3818 RepID=A0A445DXH1_ARAHY|nr:hypothetical protein Ahy_A03g014322 isoform F [Arachis hypogaea]
MTGFVYQFIRVYQLKILSVGITFGGPTIFRYKDQFKEPIFLAFDSTSWKVLFSLNLVDNVNRVADHLLQSLLGSQVHYYPIDQYRYDLKSFSSFIMAILLSSHHESLKAQKAINGTRILSEIAGHFLKNLKSQLPQTRILAISALNTLLKKSPYKLSPSEKSAVLEDLQGNTKSSLEEALTHTFNG